MRKQTAIILIALLAIAMFVPFAAAQNGTVRGKILDDTGKPINGVTVEFLSPENGRKFIMKTNAKGEFVSLGVAPGRYNVTFRKDNVEIWKWTGITVQLGDNPELIVDLAKEKKTAHAQAVQEMSPEEKARLEQQQRESVNIKNLNAKLAEAQAATDAGNHDLAVQILEGAVQVDATKHLIWGRLALAYLSQAKKLGKAEAAPILQKAVEVSNKAIELAINAPPTDKQAKELLPGYHNNQGEALGRLGRIDEAVAAYNAAAAASPTNAAQYYFNLGAIMTNQASTAPDQTKRMQMIEEANGAFEKAIQSNPQYANAYYQKALNLLAKPPEIKDGKMVAPPPVVEALNKYLELEPEGRFAADAKAILQGFGQEIQTTYKKAKPAGKK